MGKVCSIDSKQEESHLLTSTMNKNSIKNPISLMEEFKPKKKSKKSQTKNKSKNTQEKNLDAKGENKENEETLNEGCIEEEKIIKIDSEEEAKAHKTPPSASKKKSKNQENPKEASKRKNKEDSKKPKKQLKAGQEKKEKNQKKEKNKVKEEKMKEKEKENENEKDLNLEEEEGKEEICKEKEKEESWETKEKEDIYLNNTLLYYLDTDYKYLGKYSLPTSKGMVIQITEDHLPQGSVCVEVKGAIYLTGGSENAIFSTSGATYQISLQTQHIHHKPNLPTSLHPNPNPDSNPNPSLHSALYALDKKAFILKKGLMITPRLNHSLCALNIKQESFIYAAAGLKPIHANNHPLASCEKYNVREDLWQNAPSLPYSIQFLTLCPFNNHAIYAIGGTPVLDPAFKTQNQSPRPSPNSIPFLDLNTEESLLKWEMIQITNQDRVCFHRNDSGAIQIDTDSILVFGGEEQQFALSSAFIFNVKLLTIESIAEMKECDKFPNRGIVFASGEDLKHNKVYAMGSAPPNIHIYDIDKQEWDIVRIESWHPHIENIFIKEDAMSISSHSSEDDMFFPNGINQQS